MFKILIFLIGSLQAETPTGTTNSYQNAVPNYSHYSQTARSNTTSTTTQQAMPQAPAASGGGGGNIESTSGSTVTQAVTTVAKSAATYAEMQSECSYPTNVTPCVMAALAAVQGVAQVATAASSSSTNKSAKCSTCRKRLVGYDANGNPIYDEDPGSSILRSDEALQAELKKTDAELKKGLEKLKGMGIVYDPATNSVKLPSGKSISANSMGSVADMKAAGLTDANEAQINAALKEAQKKGQSEAARLAALLNDQALANGGSVTVKNKKYIGEDSGFDMNAYMQGLGNRGPASTGVAGLTRSLGNDSIGVSGDNIFHMVHRQYESQKNKNSFIHTK